jgi:Kef-type K+ transport system membrane component KefB
MAHVDVPHLLGVLAIILVSARLLGLLAHQLGQPAVLGELLAGVLLGSSVFGLVDPTSEILHVFAELGVVILLLEIGLETDMADLLRVGGAATAVAAVGVVLPFALGYGVCVLFGLSHLVATVAGATLTATSVGITARVLSDLGRLQEPESRVILGAAVIDDVLGLIMLAMVAGLAKGEEVTAFTIARTAGVAFGFLAVTLALGRFAVQPVVWLLDRPRLPGGPVVAAVSIALLLAWLAAAAGSAVIIGAFAAGLLLRRMPGAHAMEGAVARLGHFFVPIFFVMVGAAVDVRMLNPLDPANRSTLLVGALLVVAAVIGKLAAGYAPFWFRGRKLVIGVGMVPRGEVGLIFAQMGLTAGVFDAGLFGAAILMVMVTTFLAPVWLKHLFPPVSRVDAVASGKKREADRLTQ